MKSKSVLRISLTVILSHHQGKEYTGYSWDEEGADLCGEECDRDEEEYTAEGEASRYN